MACFVSQNVVFIEDSVPFHFIYVDEHTQFDDVYKELVLYVSISEPYSDLNVHDLPLSTTPWSFLWASMQPDATNVNLIVFLQVWLMSLLSLRVILLILSNLVFFSDDTKEVTNVPPTSISSFDNVSLRRLTRKHQHKFFKGLSMSFLLHGFSSWYKSDPYSILKYLSYGNLAFSHWAFLCNVSIKFEPTFFHQAVKGGHSNYKN